LTRKSVHINDFLFAIRLLFKDSYLILLSLEFYHLLNIFSCVDLLLLLHFVNVNY